MTIEIISIKDYPELKDKAIAYCCENWPPVKNGFISFIEQSLTSENVLPMTFLLMKDEKIIGFYQLIYNECVMRKDLSPWITTLFIDEKERGCCLGSVLLEHGRKTLGQLGYEAVYLTTDHIQFYEKYGFKEIGLDQFDWGRPTKLYQHNTIK